MKTSKLYNISVGYYCCGSDLDHELTVNDAGAQPMWNDAHALAMIVRRLDTVGGWRPPAIHHQVS